jgi:hypothetical protein
MRPKSLTKKTEVDPQIPQLPPKKTLVQLFADFMSYLNGCAKSYVEESHPNGVALWTTLERHGINYVFAHPNGWEGPQQQQMRQAAVLAGLIPQSELSNLDRIAFVTEGEASLHFCEHYGLTTESIKVLLHILLYFL